MNSLSLSCPTCGTTSVSMTDVYEGEHYSSPMFCVCRNGHRGHVSDFNMRKFPEVLAVKRLEKPRQRPLF